MISRKLSDADIAAIRASDKSNLALAAEYNVSQSTIQRHRPQYGKHEPRSDSKDSYLMRIENDERRRRNELMLARSVQLQRRATDALRVTRNSHERDKPWHKRKGYSGDVHEAADELDAEHGPDPSADGALGDGALGDLTDAQRFSSGVGTVCLTVAIVFIVIALVAHSCS